MRDRDDSDEETTTVMPDAAGPQLGVGVAEVTSKLPLEANEIAPSSDFHSGQFRTRFANSAVSLAEQFALLVGGKPVRGQVQFRVELSTPDGPSTGGGAQALQHVKLVPSDGGATLIAGSIHLVERTAELRTLDYLEAEHAKRFSRSSLTPPPPPSSRIDTVHYEELLERLRNFCADQDFKVSTTDAARGAPTVLRAVDAPAARHSGVALAVATVFFFATIALVFVVLRGR